MILGIGCDIIEINRVGRAVRKQAFCRRVFSEAEAAYCAGRGRQAAASFAARFAAKEAVLKALGTGLRYGSLREIEILPDALGKPEVRLSGRHAQLAAARGAGKILLTLSHSREMAMACAVVEGER